LHIAVGAEVCDSGLAKECRYGMIEEPFLEDSFEFFCLFGVLSYFDAELRFELNIVG